MVAIIKAHNRLNGLIFSIAEYASIALFVGAFAVYYLFHKEFVLAFVAWGIAFNCLPVVALGIGALRDKEREGRKTGSYWDKFAREKLRRENPHMLRDTLALTAATLAPWALLAITLVETLRARGAADD